MGFFNLTPLISIKIGETNLALKSLKISANTDFVHMTKNWKVIFTFLKVANIF